MANYKKGLASADEETREEVAEKGGEARAEELGHEGYEELGHKGGEAAQKKGSSMNPGNFKNRPHEEVEEAAEKGGKN